MDPLRFAKLILTIVVSLILLGPEGLALKKKETPTKTIRGQVVDKDKQPVSGAKVFVRIALKDKTTILVSDESGLFSIYGLDPQLDYIVHAESGNLRSEKKTISHYLNRIDNFLALELVAGIQGSSGNTQPVKDRFEVELGGGSAFKLMGDWYEPQGAKEKSPAVLLVHGFGEDRHTWDPFIQSYLLPKGFGVLSLDLRGHGGSTLKGSETVQAQPNWTSEPNQFPVDIAVAVNWLKSKQGIDANRIACIGGGMGADLAYFASGKFEEIRTAVALSPTAETALNWVKGIQNFQPHSILFVAAEGDLPAIDSSHQLETLTGFPVQVRIILNSNLKGSKLVRDTPAVAQIVIEWIQKNI